MVKNQHIYLLIKNDFSFPFQMHISLETDIPDHCCQFALSSDSGEYSVACSHSYDAACANCNDLYHVIEGIKQAAGEVEFESEDQKDDIQYSLSQVFIKCQHLCLRNQI